MSTRGFVGIGTPTDWDARYNHYDSYPTGLGAEVWATAQNFLRNDGHLHEFAQRLLHFTDWRQMQTDGICEYCGQKTGQPHSISVLLCVSDITDTTLDQYRHTLQTRDGLSAQQAQARAAEDWPIILNRRQTGYPDPDAHYHQHDSLNPAANAITPAQVDWLFMEWGYIVDPTTNVLHVFVGLIQTPVLYTSEYIRPDGRHDAYPGRSRYTGVLVDSLNLQEAKPDWTAIEQTGDALCEQWTTTFAENPHHPLLEPLRQLPTVEIYDQRAPANR